MNEPDSINDITTSSARPRRPKFKPSWQAIVSIAAILLIVAAVAYWNIGLSIYNQGVSAHNALDAQTAHQQYTTVARFYPNWMGSFARLSRQNRQICQTYLSARQAYDAQDYPTACTLYQTFRADYPTDRLNRLVKQEHPAAFLAWAQQDDKPGSYATAIEHYQALLQNDPDSDEAAQASLALPAAYFHYGTELADQGQYQAALDALHAVSQWDDQKTWSGQAAQAAWQTYRRWGDALQTAGNYEQAIARYQDAIAEADDSTIAATLWPPIGQAYLSWSRTVSDTGDYAQAISLCVSAMQAFPQSDWIDEADAAIGQTYLAWADSLRQSSQYRQAVDTAQSGIAGLSKSKWHEPLHSLIRATYLEWANSLYQKQDYAQAITVYQMHRKEYPKIQTDLVDGKIITAYQEWTQALWKARDYQKAYEILNAMLFIYPNHAAAQSSRSQIPQIHFDWAADAYQRRDFATAVAHYQAGIKAEEEQLQAAGVIRPPTVLTYTFTVNTDSANVRKGPDKDQPAVAAVKRDDQVVATCRSADSQWLKIIQPVGWVYAPLLVGKTPAQNLPFEGHEVMIGATVLEASPRAAQAWQTTAQVLYEWGQALNAQSDYAAAAATFRQILDDYAHSAVITQAHTAAVSSYLAWGDAMSRTQKYDQAAQAFSQILEIEPPTSAAAITATNSAAAAYLAWGQSLYGQKAYAAAIEKYSVVYTSYAQSSQVSAAYAGIVACYTEWGDSFKKDGKYSEAIAKYQAIVTLLPKSQAAAQAGKNIATAYNLWGAALHTQKNYTDAMAKFSLAWQSTTDADLVTAAKKGYSDALWALAKLTDATGKQIMNNALTTACNGQAAGSPAVGLDTVSAGKALSNSTLFALPTDLIATMPANMRYAICASNGVSEIQRCPYTGGHTLIRQQLWWKVTVRSAKTGAVVSERMFYGSTPDSCPYFYTFYGSTAYKSGSSPSGVDVVNWLKGIIK